YMGYKLFYHVQVRVAAWLNPWPIIDNKGYQITQSLFAIGTGGLFGMGLFEGMPNAMLEAMALGLPVIATDCPPGGPRMVINSGENGLLVPVGDKEAMVKAINELIENPEYADRLGKNASKISEIANAEAIYREWEKYLKKICN
ncbi:MAG: glycosyltransferase, partial [Lachnospiraceae bacterium]|nr:glycosyltransferase [Lachnospiraceae bacterium]